jgi:hypothetical protein
MKTHTQTRRGQHRPLRPPRSPRVRILLRAVHAWRLASHAQPFSHHTSLPARHSQNQSLAKHNRKPPQISENKHQRPKSIASFCRFPVTCPASQITGHVSPTTAVLWISLWIKKPLRTVKKPSKINILNTIDRSYVCIALQKRHLRQEPHQTCLPRGAPPRLLRSHGICTGAERHVL